MIAPTTKVVSPEDRGDTERMTERQAAELRRLTEAQGEVFDASLSQDEAARRIATLKELDDF